MRPVMMLQLNLPTITLICFAIFVAGEDDFYVAPSGIVTNYAEFTLQSKGFVKCYDAPYSASTTEESFDDCRDASWLFVGAKQSTSAQVFIIGAHGFASDIFTDTKYINRAYEHNGVYWYMKTGNGFGFSSTRDIWLEPTDTMDDHNNRLSWRYDATFGGGGMRAAQYTDLESNTAYRKIIYKLRTTDNAPTAGPTVALPLCNVANNKYLGDGFCDEAPYNTAECDYDRGDCCALSCVARDYECGYNGYTCIQPTAEIPTRNPSRASSVPSVVPSVAPSAPTVNPTIAPSAPTVDPTAVPTETPTTPRPTMQPTLRATSSAVSTFRLDSNFPYGRDEDVFKTFEFPNATDGSSDYYYFTTITFSESTMLREDSDFITIYKDSQLTDVYGDREYTGVRFPGMNGEAALGFRSSSFVFHFHSDAGDVPEDHGYSMSVTITRQVASDNSDSGGAAEGTYAGMSRSGVIVLISFCVIVACFSCCGLPYWYLRAHASSKIAMESQDRRKDRVKNVRELEANKIVKRSTKKGKSAMYVEDFGDGKESDVKDKGSSIPVLMCPEGPPPQYTCSISCELMTDPVICADGFTYEREDIEMWLSTHDTSPLTNIALVNKTLIPNLVLKEIIAEYKRSQISKDDAS